MFFKIQFSSSNMLEIMAWIVDNDETRTQHEHAIYHSKSNNSIQYDEDEKYGNSVLIFF